MRASLSTSNFAEGDVEDALTIGKEVAPLTLGGEVAPLTVGPQTPIVRPFPVVLLLAHGEPCVPPREFSTITTTREPIYI
jgi:hypothetical protein